MSDYLSTLPVELIHKILDNVPTLDILSSICLVNKRLRSVSLTYPCCHADFSCMNTSMNKNQFDCICTQLLHSISQVKSLTLFDKNDPMTPVKNFLFFSRFSCINSTFSSLRSLTLTYINYDAWRLFKTRLPSFIVTLSIHLAHVGARGSSFVASNILSELLFFSPSLERLSVKMSNYSDEEVKIRPRSPTILSSLQYFHLEDIIIDLSSLFFVVPMLHTLEVRFYNLVWEFSNIHPQPLHLQRLRIDLWFIRWTRMVDLLLSFPRLTYLTVIGENLGIDMADGFAWTQLLKDIEHFEFSLQFHWIGYVEQSIVLDSFRTKFWLEEKKWFVTYDQNLTGDYSILYTNSSSVSNYPSHSMIGFILSESTGSQPTSFPHVHCLTINYQNIKRALLHRYTHITELKLSQIDTTFPPTFKDLITYLDTSRIITCSVSSEWIGKSPHELTEFLRSLPRLRALSVSVYVLNYLYRHRWPDIIHLRIENNDEDNFQLLSSNEINTLYRSFTHIERLDIHSESVIDLPQFLNRIKRKTLTEIIIRQQRKVRNEHLITREWIEENTELQHFHYARFHYARDAMNSVSLWF